MFTLDMDNKVQLVFSLEATEFLGKNYWYLDTDIDVRINQGEKAIEFKILRGFLTDGTSITRLLHALIPVWDKNTDGVVVHDWLCNHPEVIINGKSKKLARHEIDEIFLEIMKLNNISKVRRTLMYAGVRMYDIFGFKAKPAELKLKAEVEDNIRANLPKCECA